MRLELILPQVEPTEFKMPQVCPHEGCQGRRFEHHQEVEKALKDVMYEAVIVHRYRCVRCKGTFRVYPQGVTQAQASQRVKGLGVMLYLLGLSYGVMSLALEALGMYMSKSSVYEAVQAAAEKVPGMKRKEVFAELRTLALGGDLTSVRCSDEWLPLGLAVNDTTGLVLTVDELPAEDAEALKEWLEPIAEQVGAELLVSDDADAFKTVANELGLAHQVCKSHVKRNTEAFIDNVEPKVESDEDGSLAAIGVTPQQALKDLRQLGELILSRQPEEEYKLEEMHHRYTGAAPPRQGEKATAAYRLRLMYLDRWNLWRPLTRYRTWQGPMGETVDGTNNGCERAIGWWVKERYRTMRGYKRPKSAMNVSRLLAYCGNIWSVAERIPLSWSHMSSRTGKDQAPKRLCTLFTKLRTVTDQACTAMAKLSLQVAPWHKAPLTKQRHRHLYRGSCWTSHIAFPCARCASSTPAAMRGL